MRSARILACTALALGVACSGEKLPYAGGLMVAVQTDYSVPKDITAVGLYITSDGRPIFGDTRQVAPTGEVKFPATLAVLADSARPRAVVKIRAVGFKADGDVRVLRDIVTTIPKGRTGLLRAPLTWINEGSGTGNRNQLLGSASLHLRDVSDGFTKISSICPEGQTSLQGDCADAHVDGDALPDYSEKDVFGGGDAMGSGGRCFDVLACFATTLPVTIDSGPCTATIAGVDPNDPNLSLAVVLPAEKNVGECRNDACFVPLDKGSGWTSNGSTIQLPSAMCRKIGEGKARGLVATLACPVKDPTTPSCGLASAVSSGSKESGSDAGPPVTTQDFEPPSSYGSEPNLTAVRADADYLFVARAEQSPAPSGVVRLKKSDVIASKNPAEVAVLFGYSGPQASTVVLATPSPSTSRLAARGENGEIHLCTPSGDDCASVTIVGRRSALAVGEGETYAFGTYQTQLGLFAIPVGTSTPETRGPLPDGSNVTALHYASGSLFIGGADGSIFTCTAPCQPAASIRRIRDPLVTSTVTAIATSSKVPNKIFFIRVATGADSTLGGVFQIGIDGNGETRIASAEELGAVAAVTPTALAVDSEYVYWGGNFDDARGGGRKSGLLRHRHVGGGTSQPFLENAQGLDEVTDVTVDDFYVFWSYRRADSALLFAKKNRSF